MKKDLHPEDYRFVVFKDVSCDYSFLTRSTINTKETIKWKDGKEYPLYKMDISSKSHPYFTGQQNLIDTAGRIEKFNQRYNLEKSPTSNKPKTSEKELPSKDNSIIEEPLEENDINTQDS